MIKTSEKTKYWTKMCTKEHLNPEGFAEIRTVFVGTARDFQRDKLNN